MMIVLCFSPAVFAAAEEPPESVVITTYYPSPYGSYGQLRIYPKDASGFVCTSATEGVMFYDRDEEEPKMCVCTGAACSVRSLFEAASILKSAGAPCPCVAKREGDVYYDTEEHALKICTYALAGGYSWADAGKASVSYEPGETFQVSGDNPTCPEGSHAEQYFWKARKCCWEWCGGHGSTLCCTTESKWYPTAPVCPVSCGWKRAYSVTNNCVANEWSMVTCTVDE